MGCECPRGSHGGKDWARAARDRHDGRQAFGAVDGGSGASYNLSLLDDKNLVGTATLTTGQGSQRDRDRSVKLEKKE